MFRGNGRGIGKPLRVSNLTGLQRVDGLVQLFYGYRTRHKNCVCEGPATVPWVQLGNLRVNRLHVRTAEQTGENITKSLHAGMLDQVATNRAEVVIAIEESLGCDNLRFRLRRQLRLQCITFGFVHVWGSG